MSTTSRPSDPGLSAGSVLDARWTLLRRVAAGAMGEVWEAEGTEGQVVAIKVLHPELHSEPAIRRRFRRESSVLSAIDHPAVVRVLDLGTDESARSYTVMELLRGETLEERIRRETRLAAWDLQPLLRGMADGLAAVHAEGIIHADLKPSNVFLPVGGHSPVKLVDFGLSKIEGLERLTRTGELTGTPIYMAPELLTGARDLDGRLDVYALGVVAYQALSGRVPFEARKHPGALMFDIVMGRVEPLAEAAPHLAAGVVEAVLGAMAPKREDRFADAPAFATAFEAALAAR